MATKAKIYSTPIGDRFIFDEDGDVTLPVETSLPHRFDVIDGVIVEKAKYVGLTDRQVRELDHDEAQADRDAQIAAWDALPEDERVGPRPEPLPELDLPEE